MTLLKSEPHHQAVLEWSDISRVLVIGKPIALPLRSTRNSAKRGCPSTGVVRGVRLVHLDNPGLEAQQKEALRRFGGFDSWVEVHE